MRSSRKIATRPAIAAARTPPNIADDEAAGLAPSAALVRMHVGDQVLGHRTAASGVAVHGPPRQRAMRPQARRARLVVHVVEPLDFLRGGIADDDVAAAADQIENHFLKPLLVAGAEGAARI